MQNINPIQIQKFLKGVDHPANKETLIENTRKMGADENVCASLEQLPEQDYETPVDVSEALAKNIEDAASCSSRNRYRLQADIAVVDVAAFTAGM